MSCWEVGMLVERSRLRLDRDVRVWVQDALSLPGVRLVELSPEVALAAASISTSFHGDPVDRMLVATALDRGVQLVTADEFLRKWPGLKTVW